MSQFKKFSQKSKQKFRKTPNASDVQKTGEGNTKRISLKNQVRSLRRLLMKPDLPEDVRRAKEQQISELESRIQRAQRLERYRIRHRKSASIRFFERRKAERKLEKAKKSLAMLPDSADSETRTKLEKTVEKAQNDVFYVKHFPINKKYISLFVKSEHQDPKAEKKIERIRQRILQKLEEKRKAEEAAILYDSDNEGDLDAHDDFFLHSDSDDSMDE